MSCAKDKDFRKLLQRYENTVKQLNKMNANLDNNLFRRFTNIEKLVGQLEKQVAKLEKHAYGRLSETSIKAEQKRTERDLMNFVEQAIRKYDKTKG